MREKTYKLALGGVLGALGCVFMLMGGVFPFAQFAGPCLASLCVCILLAEAGYKYAIMLYLTISIISFLYSPDLEGILLFTGSIGWYPLVKPKLDQIKAPALRTLTKLTVFFLSVTAVYWLLLKVIALPSLISETKEYTLPIFITLGVLSVITFLLMDLLLVRITALYQTRFKSKLVRNKK